MTLDLREAYLQAYVASLRPLFHDIGIEVPAVRCSCSFAYRGGRRVVGQCWPGALTQDGISQIKVSPFIDDPVEVGAILVHELVHATRPDAKHGPRFREVAVNVGLTGKMTATVPSRDLAERLREIVDVLGAYPHARLTPYDEVVRSPPQPSVADLPRKQGTRLIRVACAQCGYPARVTRKWLEHSGAPVCPCGRRMDVADPTNPLAPASGANGP